MGAPIRSQVEIDLILNKGYNSLATLGYDIIGDAKRGLDLSDTEYRDKVYRVILLRAYLKNVVDQSGDVRAYYTDPTNEKIYNVMLSAIAALSKSMDGPGIPLVRGRGRSLIYYPSTSGPSAAGGGTGGAATPGGVTFENTSVDSPGEVVDTFNSNTGNYAFYLISVIGQGVGEGSRVDVVTVNWLGSNDPVLTNYRGNDVGGSTAGVTYSAAIVSGQLQLTANVPTNGWVVRGTRISFQNISFQNAQGPLPTGGTTGQFLTKVDSVDFNAQWSTLLLSLITDVTASVSEVNKLLASDSTTTKRKYKEIASSTWNMDTDSTMSVLHGIPDAKIGTIRVIAVNISTNSGQNIPLMGSFSFGSQLTEGGVNGAIQPDGSGGVILCRRDGGLFDSSACNAATAYVVITYEE